MGGSRSGIFCTPRESPYMAMAPGKHQRKKTKMAGMRPAWINAILKSIFVLAGPGSACERANISWYLVFVLAIYTMLAEVAYEYYSHIQAPSLDVMDKCVFEAFLTLVRSLFSKTIPVFFLELILCLSASPLPQFVSDSIYLLSVPPSRPIA
jgi:hypothetical protein